MTKVIKNRVIGSSGHLELMVPRRFDHPIQTTVAQQFASDLRHKESKYVSFSFCTRRGDRFHGLPGSSYLLEGLRLRALSGVVGCEGG
jgi:hypothetical protein